MRKPERHRNLIGISPWFLTVALLASALSAAPAGQAALLKSHVTHYGTWGDADIPTFKRFGLVALQPGMYAGAATEAQAIALVRALGTKVLMYISLGEDASTYNNGPPARGDGRGPVHWSAIAKSPIYLNKGVASYYLDEWNAKGFDPDSLNMVPDGIPDRQGDWGSCYVNAGDAAWQGVVLDQARKLMALGVDGLFMDTPETPNPWRGYGWTSQGMHDLIGKLRQANPGKVLILNRGLFFFDPDYPLQYRWNPRTFIDGVIFESYYTGSNYPADLGGNGSWRLNPYFLLNKYVSAPRLNAEMGRFDSSGSILHIDYAADHGSIALIDPAFYQRVQQETAVEQGWVTQISDRLLKVASVTVLDNPAPPDRSPPKWQNSAVSSADSQHIPRPRVGLLKAIPGNGSVTLRWDVAADQTRPVRYNVYYSKDAPLDFAASPRLPAVNAGVGADYTDRARNGADDGCPYEFTLTGLANNSLYRFAVRAEDATTGMAAPAGGRTGPGGGLEETNFEVLLSIPRDTSGFPIVIDGAFGDWDKVPAIPDSAGDGGSPDLTAVRVTDDRDGIFFQLEFAGAADPSKIVFLFNADSRSFTGDAARVGAGFQGADFKWENGSLYRFQPWEWIKTGASADFRAAGNRMEIRIQKKAVGGDLGATTGLLIRSSDSKETFPDHGIAGMAYTYTHPLPGSNGIRGFSGQRRSGLAIDLRRENGAATLLFRNPLKHADIRIQDVRGRVLGAWSGVRGERLEWGPGSASGIMLISVGAKGLLPVTQAFFLGRDGSPAP